MRLWFSTLAKENLIENIPLAKDNFSLPIAHFCLIFSNFSLNVYWVRIFLKTDEDFINSGQNRQFFVLCDLEIWQMTLKNNRVPLLCCLKLCASFHSHQSIQPGVTVRKRPIRLKIGDFFFIPYDLEIWRMMTLKNNRAPAPQGPALCCSKLCASYWSHGWIQTGVTVRKPPIWVKIDDFI